MGVSKAGGDEENSSLQVYDLPVVKTSCLKKTACCTYIPFMPSYTPISCRSSACCRRCVRQDSEPDELYFDNPNDVTIQHELTEQKTTV